MVQATLQKIGLSDKEINVYLTSLRLGPSSVRKIADSADINRGTTYDILKSLRDMGLISYYHKDKKQFFMAEDPERLQDAIAQKQQTLKETQSEIARVIPQLKSIYDKAGDKPVVRFYDGASAITTILQDVIASCQKQEQHEYFAYSSSTIKKYLYDVYPNFSKDRIKAGISVKALSIGPGGDTRGLDERKWLSKKESAPTYTLLYANKMAIISIDADDKPIGVIIEDSNIYLTQKMIFDSLWDKLN